MASKKVPNHKLGSSVPQHGSKNPVSSESSSAPKVARSLRIDSDEVLRRCLVWRFEYLDPEWPPGALKLTVAQYREALVKLGQFELQTVGEVWASNTPNNVYSTPKSPTATQNRLEELERDDEDCIHSLRLQGKYRIVGVLRSHVFYVLWIDPDHEVWPSPKKHT